MNFTVDNFGKVTISFGGICPLKCSHCYTVANQFVHSRLRKMDAILNELHALKEKFTTICISGDTDPFLFPEKTLDLLSILSTEFPWTDIMITSRLIPDEKIINGIIDIGVIMSRAERLLIPGISVITYSYPNSIEDPRLVPSTKKRLELLRNFSIGGLPCFLAMRPTFPFAVVSKSELKNIVKDAAPYTTVFLGEAFIIDPDNEISKNIGLEKIEVLKENYSPMTFLSQPNLWEKRIYSKEAAYIEALCSLYDKPYFMRSMSGLNYIKKYWDYKARRIKTTPKEGIDKSLERFLP